MNTKNEWVFRGVYGKPGEVLYVIIDKNNELFAEIYFSGIRDRKEIAANACLIAAAPELLEVCEDAFDILNCGEKGYVIEKLKRIIKKAKYKEVGIDCDKPIKWITHPHYEDCGKELK